MEISLKAYGKINLGLDVVRRREDGYHEVKMIMQTVDLWDELTFCDVTIDEIVITSDSSELPDVKDNIIYKACRMMKDIYGIDKGVHVAVDKHIPVAAGMAGGSADAAAALKAMNILFGLNLSDEQLMEHGVKLGADVPYCIMQGTALSEGIGEILTPLPPMPDCLIVIAKPAIGVSTKWVYQNLKVDLLEEHPDTASYISESQNVWGKIFNTHEINILLGLVDYLGLDWDYVLILLSYCRRLSERRGSTKSLHYVETVAFGFYDEGICDAVSLQDKLRQMELMAETEGQLRSLFGMGSRALSTTEKRYFSAWLYDYGYGMDIIRRAYEITVDAIGEPKVKYTNSILSSWNSKGLKTLDAVNAFVEASDRERGKGKGETARRVGSTFETDSFFAAALRRNFGDEEADPGKATPSPDANS